ncbi:MAG: hypothetical protein Q9182_004642 [Xanthomendoza sp. 2 TL-2023]
MAPPRLLLIFLSISTLTLFLTWLSLSQSHSKHYTAAGNAAATEPSRFRSLFSFRTPSALFPSSAIISLTDDNSTFFLSRPADFGPSLPPDGLSAQLWVGSGFADDSLGRGLAAETEGELGCSDVPGWRVGRKHHQGDSQFEPSLDQPPSIHETSAKGEQSKISVQDVQQRRERRDDAPRIPSEEDGTDDHLHHPLPASRVSKPAAPGRAADAERTQNEQPPQHADIQSLQESAEIAGKLVLLSRGGCGFLEKVKWVQRRGGVGLIVGDNTRGGALVTMYARGDTSNVTIPALFTSRTTAHLLSSLIPPERLDKEDVIIDTDHPEGAHLKLGDDRPTFTPTASFPRPTSTMPAKAGVSLDDQVTTRTQQHQRKRGWLRSLFGLQAGKEIEPEGGATEDSRRPPSSGRLTWVNEQWTESAIAPGKGREKGAIKETHAGKSSSESSGSHVPPRDGFEIGVHDWRDPDLVGAETAKSLTSTPSCTSTKLPTSTGPNDSERLDPGNSRELSGGSITPGSGEYGRPNVASPAQQKAPNGSPGTPHGSHEQRQSWLGRILWGSRSGQAGVPYWSEDSTSSNAKDGDAVAESLDKATANASMKQKQTNNTIAPGTARRQYHGKQVECVVCLEEYIDGQSKVMSLPCGHEFHAECITPWLTTRRRTCPICKGDVVRSMAKPAKQSSVSPAQPRRSSNENPDDIQVQAAETRNESPTAAIPIPREPGDLERGDDMAATLVNDAPEASSARRGWRGLASFSLSAFSGEAAWRQAQADRNR